MVTATPVERPQPRRAAVAARRIRDARRRAVRPRLVREPSRSIGAAALLAAAWSLGIGLLLCAAVAVLGWALGGQGSAGFDQALRAGGLTFVTAHHVPVTGDGVTYTLLPLGLLAVPAVLTYRAGRWAGRSADCASLPDVMSLAGAAALAYGLALGLICVGSQTGSLGANPLVAAAFGAAVAFVGVGIGVSGGPRSARAVRARVPARLRDGAYAGLATIAALGAGSGVLLAVALVARLPAVAEGGGAVAPGAGGGAALALLGLLYLPNVLVWAGAYASGAGFVLGGAVVSPLAGAGAGTAPAFPLLLAAPVTPPGWAPFVLLVPLAAGVVGGLVLARRARGLRVLLVDLLATAGCAAVLAGLLALVSGGALGDGRLAQVGPTAWLVALAVAGEVLAGATLGVVGVTAVRRLPSRAAGAGMLRRVGARLYDSGRE